MLDTFGPQSAAVPADLQLKLTDNKSSLAAAGMGMENGSGKKLIEISGAALSKRKLLVGLDLLCLFLGTTPLNCLNSCNKKVVRNFSATVEFVRMQTLFVVLSIPKPVRVLVLNIKYVFEEWILFTCILLG